MMYLVDINGKVRDRADEFPQFVSQSHALQFFFRNKRRVLIAWQTVENNLLGIGNGNQSLQVFKRLVVVNLLGIGILDAVTLIGSFLLIQNLELNQTTQFSGRRFRDNP